MIIFENRNQGSITIRKKKFDVKIIISEVSNITNNQIQYYNFKYYILLKYFICQLNN